MSEPGSSITARPEAGTVDRRHSHDSDFSHHPHPLRFAFHVLEMLAAMGIGMGVGAAVFTRVAGLTAGEAFTRYPALSVVVLALSMTVPMVAWMRLRGHGARSCVEMTLSMVVPAMALLALHWLGVVADPASPYCCVSMWAMVILMIYRRTDYGM